MALSLSRKPSKRRVERRVPIALEPVLHLPLQLADHDHDLVGLRHFVANLHGERELLGQIGDRYAVDARVLLHFELLREGLAVGDEAHLVGARDSQRTLRAAAPGDHAVEGLRVGIVHVPGEAVESRFIGRRRQLRRGRLGRRPHRPLPRAILRQAGSRRQTRPRRRHPPHPRGLHGRLRPVCR